MAIPYPFFRSRSIYAPVVSWCGSDGLCTANTHTRTPNCKYVQTRPELSFGTLAALPFVYLIRFARRCARLLLAYDSFSSLRSLHGERVRSQLSVAPCVPYVYRCSEFLQAAGIVSGVDSSQLRIFPIWTQLYVLPGLYDRTSDITEWLFAPFNCIVRAHYAPMCSSNVLICQIFAPHAMQLCALLFLAGCFCNRTDAYSFAAVWRVHSLSH